MPSIESGPGRISAVEAITPNPRPLPAAASAPERQPKADAPAVVLSEALTASKPPFDGERVAEIRKAIADGRYPIIPFTVADAMIAAGFLLRSDA